MSHYTAHETSETKRVADARPARRHVITARTFAALLALSVAACAVGPDYREPASDLAAFHNLPTTNGGRAVAPSLDSWWTGFNDPMLVTVVQRALSQNLDLAAALARVQQARAAAVSAGAQLLPTLDANAQALTERQSVDGSLGTIASSLPGYRRNQQEYDVGIAASWEIDIFGGLRRGAAAATAEEQAAEADHLGTRISIAADAGDAYLQVRGFQARLATAQDQTEVDRHLLDLVRLRQSRGIANDREVAQAEALLLQAKASVPMLRVELEAQLNRLDVLMGVQPGTYAQELAKPGRIPDIPALTGDSGPVDMLRRRPDIIAAERRLAASNERIGLAISDYYPKISLSGALGFDSLSTSNLFTPKAFQPIGAGSLRWRLFDFGKVDAEVAQARGENAEALAIYRQTTLKAAEDVENAFIALTQTEARMQELQEEVVSLVRARNLSQQAYQAGAIPLTDVLDADRQLLSTQDELDSSRSDAARAAVRSFRALGGGWDPVRDPGPRVMPGA